MIQTATRNYIKKILQPVGDRSIRHEIITGLQKRQKVISSKYFYDYRGSELFEQITALDEYYPTRTEKKILRRIAPYIMQRADGCDIIELGSGDCSKIKLILDGAKEGWLPEVTYVPVDVSAGAIRKSMLQLQLNYEGLTINGYVADFTQHLPQIPRKRDAIILFLGSTLGNLETEDALQLLRMIRRWMRPNDLLLLGMDMEKPIDLLHAAYNDSKGVTATFNRNILNAVNDIIDSDFDIKNFRHRAFYNSHKKRIEMHLESTRPQQVSTPYLRSPLVINEKETIHTENSHKYTLSSIAEMAYRSELKINNIHFDDNKWFSITELRKSAGSFIA